MEHGNLPYNPSNKDSIISYALLLQDKSLGTSIDLETYNQTVSGNKGGFGQVLEKYYFYKELDSESQPDFPEAGLELKASPLKKLQKRGELRAKERLVLNIINYLELVNQDFDTSSFYSKNKELLLVFYEHSKDKSILDYPIRLIGAWRFPDDDLKVIKHDWHSIKNKVNAGDAHKLSEGDTFYLGACTKGANASSLRKQPNSDIMAMQRAFSLKQGYVNHIIAKLSNVSDGSIGKIIIPPQLEEDDFDIEDIIINKFKQFYGISPQQIAETLNLNFNPAAKSGYADLTKAILGVSESKKEIEEFTKAEVTIRTIRLDDNNLPKENISFPAFSYEHLITEEWESSDFAEQLEMKFLFIFYKQQSDGYVLNKALFWNMSYEDRQEAKAVWEKTKQLIMDGKIVENVTWRRETYFPKSTDNRVAHVRPHAKNAADTVPLPVPDQLTNVTSYTKHSFWLNATFVRDSIYESEA